MSVNDNVQDLGVNMTWTSINKWRPVVRSSALHLTEWRTHYVSYLTGLMMTAVDVLYDKYAKKWNISLQLFVLENILYDGDNITIHTVIIIVCFLF